MNEIKYENNKWELIDGMNNSLHFDQILIACGSSNAIWKSLEKLGHPIHAPVPSLFTFNIQNPIIQNLMGISVKMYR
ncbi:MAG: NAD(P)/FAD-dependent oxidoreductase [Bacteroidetes bacterium]|nr:NAD(P)/FAD-dependent oxidoreductase [Bacteroidota bacterium]